MGTMRRAIWNNLIMPVGDRLTRQKVGHYLDYYRRSQYWPVEDIKAEQNRLLRETLSIAYGEVPYYRELFDSAGIKPEDIRSTADLPAIPVSTKQMLRDAFPDRCTRATGQKTEHQATSGSTGSPFQSIIDADSQSRARALMFLRAMACGYQPGDLVVQTGSTPKRGRLKSLKDWLLGVTYVSALDMADANLDRILGIMESKRIKYLMGNAQNLYLLALRASEVGFGRTLAGVVSWGSLLLPEHRQAVRSAFNASIHDTYGVSEGMQIAFQCGAQHGEYHQLALHVAIEFCDNGQPVPVGKQGDILLTRLNPGAMPFIRYKVGDLGTASDRDSCECGRGLPLIASIIGRTSDLITTPNGNRLTVHFFSSLFGHVEGIKTYQVTHYGGARLKIKIAVTTKDPSSLFSHLEQMVHQAGDPNLIVEFEQVADIPLDSTGKHKYIVCKD